MRSHDTLYHTTQNVFCNEGSKLRELPVCCCCCCCSLSPARTFLKSRFETPGNSADISAGDDRSPICTRPSGILFKRTNSKNPM